MHEQKSNARSGQNIRLLDRLIHFKFMLFCYEELSGTKTNYSKDEVLLL